MNAAPTASLEMSATATSQAESSFADLDKSIATLRSRAQEFARLSPTERAGLLRECLPRLVSVAPSWVEAAVHAKGLTMGTPAEGEEWLAGPVVAVRTVRLTIEALEAIALHGKPALPTNAFSTSPEGRTQVAVYPGNALERVMFAGFTCYVRMQEGVGEREVRDRQASFYSKANPSGGVSLVLGAGNVASIPPVDAFCKMFTDGHVCLLKMNPVNEYLGPYLEQALKPLIDRGYLQIAYGAASVGSYLVYHEGITDVHITGSDRTHDMIVWGPPGEERKRRIAANDPVLKKSISSELGCVTPVVIVPAEFSDNELQFLAENIVAMDVNNASCNCNAAKMLVTSRSWRQRDDLLRRVRSLLGTIPPRKAYYPGAEGRFESLLAGREGVVKLGQAGPGQLPWALVFGLDSKDENERLFTVEPFCPILSETTLDEADPSAFLAAATKFCNDRLWGTLSACIVIHPAVESQPEVGRALATAIAELRYGAVAINHWAALVYGLVTPPWGGHPSSTLENIQGGLGWVHNTYMLEGIEKVVLRGSLTVSPKPPWFVTNKKTHLLGRKLLHFEAAPSWLKLPSIVLATVGG